jgi:hypothetical protein
MASRVENGHVLSLEKQKLRKLDLLIEEKQPLNIKNQSNLLSRKDSDEENSTNRLSSSPNPFLPTTIKFSFEAMPWLDLDMTGPSLATIHRHGPYPTLHIGIVEHIEYPWRTDLDLNLGRTDFAPQPTIIEPLSPPLPPPPAPPLKVKIPFKDKFIMVRLPPANPV